MIKKATIKIKSFWGKLALISIEVLALAVLLIASFTTFIFMMRKVFVHKRTEFDDSIFEFLRAYVTDTNDTLMQFFTFLGTHNFLIPANLLLIAYFLFIKKHKWYAIKIPAVALSSLGLMFGLKHYFGRERPVDPLLFEANGLSFPSGHALFSITFYGLLIYIFYNDIKNKYIKWSLIIFFSMLILTIGFTRIYLRVHYATDVIAGFCVGFIWLIVSLTLLNKVEKYNRTKIILKTLPKEASS